MASPATRPIASFWRELVQHLKSGQPVFVAVVADHTRHSPGSRGAKMAVKPDGSQFGTIGGGVMEAEILRRSASALDQRRVRTNVEILEHKGDSGGHYNPSGLICAGRQTMVYWIAEPGDLVVYEAFADAVEADRERELQVVEGVASVVDAPLRMDEAPVRLTTEPMVYREHAVERHRVAIAGGGHCGFALSRTMSQLGYRTSIYDIREDLFTLEENDWVDEKSIVADYVEVGPAVRYPQLTHLVVMTADLASDVRALEGAAGIAFPYVGVMGSAAKLAKIRSELSARGVDPGAWPRLYAPVGLPMTSNTPDEIAISIAAQILREREKLFAWTKPSPLAD